jgi:hypothetical protein
VIVIGSNEEVPAMAADNATGDASKDTSLQVYITEL